MYVSYSFSLCLNGKPEKYTCPSSLFFNIATTQCDKPENTKCVNDVSKFYAFNYKKMKLNVEN